MTIVPKDELLIERINRLDERKFKDSFYHAINSQKSVCKYWSNQGSLARQNKEGSGVQRRMRDKLLEEQKKYKALMLVIEVAEIIE